MSSLLIPLIFAILLGFIKDLKLQKRLAIVGTLLALVAALSLILITHSNGPQVMMMGGWKPPFGILFSADLFSALFLFPINLLFFAVSIYQLQDTFSRLKIPLMFFLQLGMTLSLLTGDFFNLFVAFEVMLSASYALIALEMRDKDLRWGFGYLVVNLVGTLGFLVAAAMIYGLKGHLNFHALSELMQGDRDNPFVVGWAYLLLGIFGLKAGLFPLFFWLPRTYPHLSPATSALFAGSLTKVGVYVLIRLFVFVLPGPFFSLNLLLMLLSGLTMLTGVLGAISMHSIRGILSYHIISQIGYMTLGLSLFTPGAIAASLLFTVHNIWAKASLFLIGGAAQASSHTDDLKKMGNLSSFTPWLAAAFLLQALALVGFPPLSGFWGKYLIILESLRAEHFIIAGIALITGWLTLFSMMKIWIGAFWKQRDPEYDAPLKKPPVIKLLSIGLIVLFSLALGILAEPAYQAAFKASNELFDKTAYHNAVIQVGGKG
ncbi:MAG: hypothetical protein KDK62_04300 [Chlamydiia bacterium]|nr:hypothetical protein [Chlamydiia bacterium]